jgi:flavorubredoxin
MMPYRVHVKKHLNLLADWDIGLIAPGHGPVYRRPEFILSAYRRWAGDETKPEVVIPHMSMYDSTAKMVGHLVDRLMEKGMCVKLFNVVDLDTGRFASALAEASTLVFASPTVLDGPHPAMAYAAYLANALKAKARYGAIIGSYGWGVAMPENLMAMLPNLKLDWFAPVITGGVPKAEGYSALDRLAAEICAVNSTETP